MYTNVINAINEMYENYTKNAVEYCKKSDDTLRHHLSPTKWLAYQDGTISREKALEIAEKRTAKQNLKSALKQIEKAETIFNASDVTEMTISVIWKKSSAWGYNPHATVTVYTTNGCKTFEGKASGCGYDKRSAAVAAALNQSMSCLKIIYDLKETNRTCYGMGEHNAYPYYEGGVGIECLHEIMQIAEFEKASEHGTDYTDFYHYKKIK